MDQVLLVTGVDMRRPDLELAPLRAALGAAGVASVVVNWTADIDWAEASLVVVRSTWDYFDHYGRFLEWIGHLKGRCEVWNPPEVLVWNSHKGYLLDLAASGVALPATSLVAKNEPARGRAVLSGFDGEVVLKPAVSGGALDTIRAPADSPVAERHLEMLCAKGDALVQAFVPAILTAGEVSLVYFGGEFSHAARKTPAPGDFRVQSQFGGRVEPHRPDDRQLALANLVMSATPAATAYARVDLVATPDGPVLMELEVIEPELFLRVDSRAAERFAAIIAEQIA